MVMDSSSLGACTYYKDSGRTSYPQPKELVRNFSPSFIKRNNFNDFSVQFLGKIKLISPFLVEKVKLTHHPQIAGSRSIVRELIIF